ncbi:MAG: DUF11 domain-containing protein [Lentisphaerae bacterium]|nr:DUF11 domain-containing protein [Lentisphaerota bacterium]
MLLSLALAGAARGQSVVQEFYVPLPEDQVRSTFLKLYTGTGSIFDSVVSLVVNAAGTRVILDHWEDGYEIDLNAPLQTSTKVWGDGNNGNGIAPGFVNDPATLPAGTVLPLRNNVSLPRNPSAIVYDGRDRVGATKAIVMSRASWATVPGSVLSGAAEVTSTLDYGTDFVCPVGENVSAASMFEVVDLYVQAADNGTTVSIDKDANGTFETAFTLNRGESYRVNGGVFKGARVSAGKPVQVHVVTGDINANYECDWFTLYPVDQWSDVYYTPVGTANNGNQAYVFAYNPGTNTISIAVSTRVGPTNFSVAANGTYQYLVPKNSGARLQSSGGAPFFALETVGANPTANNVHDWGFTLVPEGNLTTVALVGWGPGSSDLTQNGSPVWVTPVANTTIYVDLNGDRIGPLTDANGDHYDLQYTLSALQSQTIYDPDKDQTAMRVYTLDGTLITAAWGQDPAVAGSGNPFLDLGTTVLPFPVPVIRKSSVIATGGDVSPSGLSVGDTLQYTVEIDNRSLQVLGNVIVLDAPPPSLSYVTNSSFRDGVAVSDDAAPPAATRFPLDESGYIIPVLPRGTAVTFTYQALILASGSIANGATSSGATVTNTVEVPPPAGADPCHLAFTDVVGATVTAYALGADLYVTLRDADANQQTGVVETVDVTVENTINGDLETITLVELAANTNVFRNVAALPSSESTGLSQLDGTLFVAGGDTLSVSYTDPLFADGCNDAVTVTVPSAFKILYLSTDGSGSPDQDLDRLDPVATGDGTTASSVALGVIAGNGAGTTTNAADDFSSGTYTGGTGWADQWLEVGESDGTGAGLVRVTGQALVLGKASGGNTSMSGIGIRRAVSLTGTNAVTLSFAYAFSQALQADVNLQASTNGTTWTTLWNALSGSGTTNLSLSAYLSTNAQIRWVGTGNLGGGDRRLTIDDVTITSGTPNGSGGTNTATFTQTPAFCSAFALPAGGTVVITNHITIVSGSMPTNAAVIARLTYGTNAILTVTNATYNSSLGTLRWSGALGGAVTVPAGQALALTVSNSESGVRFQIDYDSTNAPSQVSLPTASLIAIDSLGVYDAAYPGGSLVSTPNIGATLYVRATVSDPFGAYDITGLDLGIDGPGGAGDVGTTLTDANVVTNDGCAKTYEYVWTTGSTEGSYTITTVAHEGTEGITDTAATAVNLIQLDLGTPCAIAFTAGDNGAVTNIYGTNDSVCVRVTDLDENTSGTAAETVLVLLTTSGGDSEALLLVETGTNTGTFAACLATSTSAGTNASDGILNAPAGTAITANYTDPNDPSDPCSDAATVPPPGATPDVRITKTLLLPADGQTLVGGQAQFDVRVVNTGSTTLNPVQVTDTFDTNILGYVSAASAPDSVVGGTLTWNSVGPLAPGGSTNLIVTFTTLAAASPTTNTASVVADGGSPTDADHATLIVTRTQIGLTKVRVTPPSGPVDIGGDVTFRITITNLSTTALAELPLEDTFSGPCFSFVSAVPAPDGIGFGSLFWADLTGAGTLPVGGTTHIDVTLRAAGGCDPAENVAAVNFAVDVFGDPVPPINDMAVVTTLASRISGTVYEDPDASGVTNGDEVVLGGVTLRLFTDPDGDGNPSDGTLVDLIATLADGTYEFLNLATGRYVIVESDPVGYTSTGDTAGANDNRIPVDLATSGDYAGNDFLDRVPPTFGTVSGQVRLDADADGNLGDPDAGIAAVSIALIQDVNGNGLADSGEPVAQTTGTDTNGAYGFALVPPGNYVVRESDLFGYRSTADTAGASDNQIGIVVTGGGSSAGNDFLDAQQTLESYRSDYVVVTNRYSRDPENTGQAVDIIYTGGSNYVAGTPFDVAYYDRVGTLVFTDTAAYATNSGFLYSVNANTNDSVTYGAWTAVVMPDGTTPESTLAAQLSSATTIQTDPFDVVSWSRTWFTDASGLYTNTYGSSNGTGVVYMQTTDRDQNQDTNTVETIALTLTNAATGDSETVTLYETGPDTGVFANNSSGQRLAFPISSNSGGSSNDGTLRFETGDTFQVRYTDPNDALDQSGAVATTQVLLRALSARRVADGVRVEWTTASEYDTAGFYVERDMAGLRTRVNAALLAALPPAPAGASYAVLDREAPAGGPLCYWLVEAEMRGGENRFGPVAVDADAAAGMVGAVAGLASDTPADDVVRVVDEAPILAARTRRAAAAMAGSGETPGTLAVVPGVEPAAGTELPPLKIAVRARGVYAMSAADLAVPAGVPEGVVAGLIASEALRLKNQGRTVTWTPLDGRVVFLGEALGSRYTATNIYWLESGPRGRMAERTLPAPAPAAGLDYPETRVFEENHYAPVAPLMNADEDFWMWDFIQAGHATAGKKTFAFSLDALADAAEQAVLTVRLTGTTKTAANPDHHAVVMINSQTVGETTWNGVGAHQLTCTFSQTLLHEGSNTLSITGILDPGRPFSIFYLNNFDVTYRRRYEAADGALACTPAGHAVITADHFARPDILVLEVGNRRRPVRLRGLTVDGEPGAYRVSFRASAGDARYYLCDGSAMGTPAWIRARPCPDLRDSGNAADVLMIAPAKLVAGAGVLADYRAAQGWTPRVLDVEDVYDAFSYGLPDPEAIRRLLRAAGTWTMAPRYALLVGAGTYDYHNNQGFGDCLIPPLVVSTPVGVLPSDVTLGDVTGDAVPEIVVGRLPVLSPAELQTVVGKIQRYEQNVAPDHPVLMAADDADASGNYAFDSRELGALDGAGTRYLNLAAGQTAAFRTALFSELRNGRRVFNWAGHGGVSALAGEGVLKTTDLAGLNNASKPTVLVALSCLLGQFALSGVDTLGELMVTDGNGAAAVWAPAGLAYHLESMHLGRGFHGRLAAGGPTRLGDAVRAGHQAYRARGAVAHMPQIMNLLGDPTLGLTGIAGPLSAAELEATAWTPATAPFGGEDLPDVPETGVEQGRDVVRIVNITGTAPGDRIDLRFHGAAGADWPAYGVDFATNLLDAVWRDISEQIVASERIPLADGGDLVVLSVELQLPQPVGYLRVRRRP